MRNKFKHKNNFYLIVKNEVISLDIKDKIYTIRNQQVMLDIDLAVLYNIENKVLNQAVKRNIERFPEDFMFQLTTKELQNLKSQFVTSRWGGTRKLPHVFTEQGIAMLAGILRSDVAIKVNIEIMRAFVSMRRFITENAQVFNRIDTIEKRQITYETKTDKQFEQVFNAIEDKQIKPKKKIFFDNQVFNAYKFISDIIRAAKESIVLVDNYVDDTILTLFQKRKKNVKITIYTKLTKQLQLDLDKYNSQYPKIIIKEFNNSHDRFLIIDNKEVYHFGASLKDLGKKWFAFSKFDKEAFKLIEKLDSIQA